MSLLDYWDTQRPNAKRRKTAADDKPATPAIKIAVGHSNNTPESSSSSSDAPLSKDSAVPTLDRVDSYPIIAESGIEHDTDFPVSNSQTELESSLPAVQDDSQAIEEYEAARLASQDEPDLHQRLQDGKWRKGRSSIYVDAFNLALETVLDEEAHLFDEVEMEVFKQWQELDYEAQYLYVRLFLRKTSAWHRINRLGYYSDIADMSRVVTSLRHPRCLPTSSCPLSTGENPADIDPAPSLRLTGEFRFAEHMDQITTLEEASSLLLLDELKMLAKEAKVQGKSKNELIAALHRSSQKQTGLGWNSKPATAVSNGLNRDDHFMQKIFDYTGDCIRLSAGPLALFERVHLVFYRSTEWTEKSLTTIILAKISRKKFPEYIVCRSSSIFPTRAFLLEFEIALRTQFQIDNILEFSGTPTVEHLTRIKDLAYKVYPRWRALLAEEQRKEETIYEYGEGAYLRRFSPAWVYTRIIHKGLHPLGRFKEHQEEHRLLTELLDQRLFHAARRGAWYQRKALLEEHYMWALTPFEGRSEDAQRKHWRRVALRTCETGLEDPNCHLIFHYDLQKRIMKLERALKIVKREQHNFGHVRLAKPAERTIAGIQVVEPEPASVWETADSPSAANGNSSNHSNSTRRGRPTVWVDEREGGECRVETMCLNWYREQGWKGYHSEGGIVRTLFSYLFYDILFTTYVPNVFQTPFQTSPLDLHTDAFYPTRASEINHRLAELTTPGAAERLLRAVHARESPTQTCAVGLDWSFALDDLVELVRCFPGEALAAICKVLAQEYSVRGGGVPDLLVWRVFDDAEQPGTGVGGGGAADAGEEGRQAGKLAEQKGRFGEVMFVEVKSENDRLSDTQRLWIHVLSGAGVRVELCNAVAREVRVAGS
ncbi:fanconi-associated nuclease 1 [Aspergillus brunneoviolaceus CBS 621.78]|uniref:VRR-NUC domain-containing protein n=1 Tax=Aspergillus brunneoviolaceus CBS 621.78 TaxID=1450534 RepID=A0ACD1FTY5_9EURO|nr:VRR-NUC domain-containing protein [Aspergillus brunneoviolaceus CBS 621.78]RAH40427.1 VRR-NUC domain-containing protein [Aspergillus brunneoviolaceus CBS 621.78]